MSAAQENKATVPETAGELADPQALAQRQCRVEFAQHLVQHRAELVRRVTTWVRSPQAAETIVDELFCKVLVLADPHTMTDLPKYLCRSAKKLAFDWIRRQIVREMSAQPVPASQASPEEIAANRQELVAVRRAVEQLPPKAKMALFMANEDGLGYREIGARLNITVDVAKRLVERAMEYLLEAVSKPVDRDPQQHPRGH